MIQNPQGTLFAELRLLEHDLRKLDSFRFQKFILPNIFIDKTNQAVEQIFHIFFFVRVLLWIAFAILT